MEPNGPIRVHLVPFVHSLSYRPIRDHLVPNYHLAGDPLELPQVPLGVLRPHFENQCCKALTKCVRGYVSWTNREFVS